MDVASSPRSPELNAYLIVCVIVAVLLVTLLVVVLFTWNKLSSDDSSAVTGSVNEAACFNTACEMVVALLGKSQDSGVPPCKHFHRHVCGRWYAKSSGRASYSTENRNDFHARVGYNLQRLASSTEFADSSTYQMALFYSSCRRFEHEHRINQVQDILSVSRIDVLQWLAATSFHELFATIVTECLRTGLVSVISVKRGEGQRIYVDRGEDLASVLNGYSDRVAYFVKDALAALSLDHNSTLTTAIVALDSATQLPNTPPTSEYHTITVYELPTSSFVLAWVLSLNRGLQNRTKVDGDTLLFARRLQEIGSVMWTLSSVDLNLASVYSLMLNLAQIMSYAITFGAQERVEASEETDICLPVTAERFRMNFPAWVAQAMEDPEVHGYFGVIVDALGSVASEPPDIQDFVLNATDVTEMQMNTMYISASGIQQAVPQMDPDNFLANIVMLMAQELVDRDGTWHRLTSQQLNGDLRYDDKVLFVPTMYLVGDMLHAEASDPVLDYSTVGVRVLAAWANILVDQSPSLSSKLAALKECAKGRINTIEEWPGGRGLPEGSLRWMLLVRWALDVALIAARRRHPEYTSKVVDTMSRDQLFFRRFCQTTCGDARAAALCDYGTRNSVLFANAFGCQEALPLAC